MAYAHTITIGAPADGDIYPGTNTTIQVLRLDLPLSRHHKKYPGGFNSPLSSSRAPTDQPQRNFPVAVPATLTSGPVQLTIMHVALVGACP
ncbi:hypothetical protein FA95DRAFT_304027 [Auriscalpium vulgare]|uniref:Uncharacterized protein n=1 Tax=Auriscalpium vulgare TaxID=40419 RepID=A0ACB8RJ82_9AGAM|nr:hypothetical protein FA95DRAFT_304027 [Auriscalpium vulgare]